MTQMGRLRPGADRESLVLVAEDNLIPTSATAASFVSCCFWANPFFGGFGTRNLPLASSAGVAVA